MTEPKRATEALQEAKMGLAHVNRVTTMGQLTASIAHEVNQPIVAVVTYAHAASRWLGARPPDLEEAREALNHIISDANRASEVIGVIRALVEKTTPWNDLLDVNGSVLETIALPRNELARDGISLRTQFAKRLTRIRGDRVQPQQVVLNLTINAIEAMRASENP